MSMTHSVVLIVPDALREKANRLSCALGHDTEPLPGRTFARALSADGSEPATHWGCHTWARAGFVGVVNESKAGRYPIEKSDPHGVAAKDVSDVAAGAITSIRLIGETTPRQHWNDVLAAQGLKTVNVKADPLPSAHR